MKTYTFNQAGAHRGAREIAGALLARGAVPSLVGIADPKPGRAREIADLYEGAGARARVFEEGCETALAKLEPSPTVLATDSVASMATVLREHTAQPFLLQGVGRGPEEGEGDIPPVIGIEGSAIPGREAERAFLQALLSAIERVTPERTSAFMRDSGFDAAELNAMRREVSGRTADRLLDLPRVAEAEHLAHLRWAGESYPLIVRPAEGSLVTRRTQALDLAPGRETTAVALLDRERVDIYVVRPYQRRDGGFVSMHVPFVAPPPPPPPRPVRTVIDVPFSTVTRTAPRVLQPAPRRPLRPAAFTD
ncbi:MAG: hypothetical protein ACOZNI_25190 [Myxococcota bacterium]